jgi:hypothetical protein
MNGLDKVALDRYLTNGPSEDGYDDGEEQLAIHDALKRRARSIEIALESLGLDPLAWAIGIDGFGNATLEYPNADLHPLEYAEMLHKLERHDSGVMIIGAMGWTLIVAVLQ